MKAILKDDRKVIVDVDRYPLYDDTYQDKNSEEPYPTIYLEDELEFIEYYGG